MLAEDIAKLMTLIPLEEKNARAEGKDRIEGGAFNGVLDKQTPFMFKGVSQYAVQCRILTRVHRLKMFCIWRYQASLILPNFCH